MTSVDCPLTDGMVTVVLDVSKSRKLKYTCMNKFAHSLFMALIERIQLTGSRTHRVFNSQVHGHERIARAYHLSVILPLSCRNTHPISCRTELHRDSVCSSHFVHVINVHHGINQPSRPRHPILNSCPLIRNPYRTTYHTCKTPSQCISLPVGVQQRNQAFAPSISLLPERTPSNVMLTQILHLCGLHDQPINLICDSKSPLCIQHHPTSSLRQLHLRHITDTLWVVTEHLLVNTDTVSVSMSGATETILAIKKEVIVVCIDGTDDGVSACG